MLRSRLARPGSSSVLSDASSQTAAMCRGEIGCQISCSKRPKRKTSQTPLSAPSQTPKATILFFGKKVAYVDLSLCRIEGLRQTFPKAMAQLEP
jgi:hypothetical protein